MTRAPVYLPPRLPAWRPAARRRRVSVLALLGEAAVIALAFFALGFGLVIIGAALAPAIPGA